MFGAAPGDREVRRRLRLTLDPYVRLAGREVWTEWKARAAELSRPSLPILCGIVDPAEREREWQQRLSAEGALGPVWADVFAVRDEAARRAGADDHPTLAAATHPEPPAGISSAFEREALEPLDRQIARAARERVARALQEIPDAGEPGSWGALWSLADHRDRFDERRTASTLDALHRGLGLARRPGRLEVARGTGWWSTPFDLLEGGAGLALGRCPGPGGLRRSLQAFGIARRGAFLEAVRGLSGLSGLDPALRTATGVVTRRLIQNQSFLEWAGIPADEGLLADLRFEESLAPRLRWAYLQLGWMPPAASGDTGEAQRIRTRATAREASPRRVEGRPEGDVEDARHLVGEALGALYEERLLRRHGSRWFLDREAGRTLEAIWDAESELCEAADVSRELDLGRIDFAPILDRFRP
ncbi:hypothetical protein ABI59_02905 [Acidobacteria bacterium Mor1]|nr:hypothetical protein ABI59_02905 [Acidobacteria bacterium Mor1]